MRKLFKIILCLIIVDFFYFSTSFTFSRGINTKMVEAVLGLVIFLFDCVSNKDSKVTETLIKLVILASGVSFASFLTMTVNNTPDSTYLTYVVSMIVWASAAYFVVRFLGFYYGNVTIELVSDYIIAVSFIQCIISLLNDMVVPVHDFTLTIFNTGGMDSVQRMYGWGDTTTVDVGGIRYALASVLSAFMVTKSVGRKEKLIPWYIFAYMEITVIGNMVARTTSVGSLIGLAYILFYMFMGKNVSYARVKTMGWFAGVLAVVVTICTLLYNTNDKFHSNLRFGFEGFFSLVEEGKWDVSSNNTLKSMYVMPDNPKTWIIGDGHFIGTTGDPNYIGQEYGGFYMGTDIGYSRFLFYFGIVGLFFFSWMIVYIGSVCMSKYREDKYLFAIFILMNFIIWIKVATDVFFIFAIFYMAAYCRDYVFAPDPEEQLAE